MLPGQYCPQEVVPAVSATPLTALESLGITEPSSSNIAIPFAAPVLPELLPVTVSARYTHAATVHLQPLAAGRWSCPLPT